MTYGKLKTKTNKIGYNLVKKKERGIKGENR